MASKYDLSKHFETLPGDEWRATFEQVEAAFEHDDGLPNTARHDTSWWYDRSRPHVRAWKDAHWRASQVNLRQGTVVFRRLDTRSPKAATAPKPPTPGEATRQHRCQPDGEIGAASVLGSTELIWCGRRFVRAVRIEPDRDAEGRPKETRYFTVPSPDLNRYGHLPFCSFTAPSLPRSCGAYVLTFDEERMYVGEAENLRKRWGRGGYARISRYNCLKKGRSTNCKINHNILCAARDGKAIHVWIHETADRHSLEALLIARIKPPLNG